MAAGVEAVGLAVEDTLGAGAEVGQGCIDVVALQHQAHHGVVVIFKRSQDIGTGDRLDFFDHAQDGGFF